MLKPAIRLLGFFSKEISEIRHQPRLILSLMLGPFLILLLFGLGYRGGFPVFRVSLVIPPNSLDAASAELLKSAIASNFTLVSADADEAAALAKLNRGEVDVVEIFPSDVLQRAAQGQQSQVQFRYAEINPLNEAWVKYLGFAEISEINRAILVEALTRLQKQSGVLPNLKPESIVSPLAPEYQNARGQALSFTTFYAPSVLALILQHIAVTLAALSLVRERLRGTLEMFRVAPISANTILLGKYLAYTLFVGLVVALLVLLLMQLGTPFLGSVVLFAALSALLILASLGIGFLISAVSNSDTQAVQLSMLTLLLSIFFSGFFLPLESFWPPMRFLADALPLTHGIVGFRDIMLKAAVPDTLTWASPAAIALVTFAAVALISNREFHRR